MASRFSIRLFITAVLTFALVIACGRAGLDDYALDAGEGACSIATCPTGCCDAKGQCRIGGDATACGNSGNRCLDCVAGGGTCARETKECGRVLTSCDATSCPNGCCTKTDGNAFLCLSGVGDTSCGKGGAVCADCGKNRMCSAATHTCVAGGCGPDSCDGCCAGNQCFKGLDGKLCGSKGQACSDCSAKGQQCVALSGPPGGVCGGTPTCNATNCAKGCCTADGTCVGGVDQTACGTGGSLCKGCGNNETCEAGKCTPSAKCGPANCTGDSCCFNDECVPGTGATACGSNGAACQNCAGQNQSCTAGKCVQPLCDAASCPNGCCQGDLCVTGAQDDACGRNGAQCSDCQKNGQVCGAGNVCRTPCNAQNCANGCCEGSTCRAGVGNARCGSGGAQCENCTAQGQTCDTNTRVCVAPNLCPEPYAGCPGGISTQVPVPKPTCSVQDLQDAAVACAQGPNQAACDAFFTFLAQTTPDCGTCLLPFKVPFNDGGGLFACAAPFVDAACLHDTACATDCIEASCDQCGGPGATNTCKQTVRNNQCNALLTQSAACVGPALQGGPGTFCNPFAYPGQGRYGRWLEGVGTHYCGP